MKLRQAFTDFIFATNTDGSGKAASYVRALDMLSPILTKHYPDPIIGAEAQFAVTASKDGEREGGEMTDYPYSAPCSYFLIYMCEIPGLADHAGHLKVGGTSFKSPKKASALAVWGSVYVHPAMGNYDKIYKVDCDRV